MICLQSYTAHETFLTNTTEWWGVYMYKDIIIMASHIVIAQHNKTKNLGQG
jgi:hypothetical protein